MTPTLNISIYISNINFMEDIMVTLNCNAKINLSLDVVGKRPDGYHNIELIFLEIPLWDEVTVTLREDGIINLSCDDKTLPTDEKNIAYKAAKAFFLEYGENLGCDISLKKNIPHGAGLAGGSADAAGVLKGLNSLLSSPFSQEKLMEIGVKLGADVPFCIMGGCAFAEGIGEVLTPLPKPQGLYYLLIKPEDSISTAYVYQNLDLNKKPENMDMKLVIKSIKDNDKEALFKYSGNIMEDVTANKCPVIYEIKDLLVENGAKKALMSGSGTTVFGIFDDKAIAKRAYNILKKDYEKIYLV